MENWKFGFLARYLFRLEADVFMAAVAERFILRRAAAT
jgi:hypothetical protein